MGQLPVEKYVLLDDIHLGGCDLEFAQKDLAEFTLRRNGGGLWGCEEYRMKSRPDASVKWGWGRDGMGWETRVTGSAGEKLRSVAAK